MRKILALVSIAVLAASAPARAQAPDHAPPRVAVWVAIAPQQQTESYRILRFAGNAPQDVVLLRSGADAATLTQAVEALLAVRRAAGDVAGSDADVRVRAATPRARAPLPWADRVLGDVRVAHPRQVARVGRLRAVRIWLPSQRPT